MTNWKEVKLESIADVIMGQSPKSEYYNAVGDGLPFLQGNRTFGLKYPIFDTYTTSPTKIAQPQDVIMSVRAPVGDLNITPVKMCLGRGVCAMRMKNGNQEFLYYLMKHNVQNLLNRESGTVFGSVNRNDIGSLEVLVPENDKIQQKVASVLSLLDAKIETNTRINNNLEQQAQALFKSVYDTNNKGVLADIVDVVESGSRPKGGAVSNGIPSIGAENIEKFGVYDYSKEKFIDKNFYDKMKRGKVISGDVLLYKDGAYTGKVSLALDGYPHDICAVNEHVFIIRSKQISSQFFLYFCLSDEKNKNYLHTLAASKAAQPGLNQGELLGLPIFIPNPTIVRDFTQSVSPMMHKIAANAIENNKLAAIRDALLPKLMSGEIDVSNVDISALTSTDKLSFTEE